MAQTQQQQTTTKVRKNYLTYPYDYFTGQQARIFFGHVWVDDIITIQYSSNQNKAPIYGYASQQFDDIAKGQFLVNGNFTIAFKETGYLSLIYQQLNNLKAPKTTNKDVLKFWLNKNRPIEEVLDNLSANDQNGQDFEDLAEALEDYVWGNFGKVGQQLKRVDQLDEFPGGVDRDGFDIVLLLGDFTNDASEHTVKVINDVHITGESTVITPDGAPVAMNYTFFARGVDERISSSFNIADEKKDTLDHSDDEINKALDKEVPTDFEVLILEAFNNKAERISSLTGKEFFSWFEEIKMEPSLYEQLRNSNINNPDELNNVRSAIKDYVQSKLNAKDLTTFKNGYYSDLSVMRFDIKLLLDDEIEQVEVPDNITNDLANA